MSRLLPLGSGTEWSQLVAFSAVPAFAVNPSHGQILAANQAARSLFGLHSHDALLPPTLYALLDEDSVPAVKSALAQPDEQQPVPIVASIPSPYGVPGTDFSPHTMVMHVVKATSEVVMVQLVECDGWLAVDKVLAEQQAFRGALLELTEIAHTTHDDNDFYQRLIERAVEVVPGAQAGSVQLDIEGTGIFRFVAAIGFDLKGLQEHTLERKNFFRDTWNPRAEVVRDFDAVRSPEIQEWLERVGRLNEIKAAVTAPVLSDGVPIAVVSLDNFEDPAALTETSVEMVTVLAGLIGDLWRRRAFEVELRREREAYRELAMKDTVTDLPNRRNLHLSLAEMLSVDREFAAVLFVDVDDFKAVNDRLGHDIGDQLLASVASGLQACVRGDDLVGRWGGDEFLVLPARVTAPEDAVALAGRIIDRFQNEVTLENGHRHFARLSIGIGLTTSASTTVDELVVAADRALYEAKAAGKGTYAVRMIGD